MTIENALRHVDAAILTLCLDAECNGLPVQHFTIAEELKRIDSAIGTRGESLLAKIADAIDEAYVELLAAKAALREVA